MTASTPPRENEPDAAALAGARGATRAPRRATRAPRAPRGAKGAQNARSGREDPERIFIIVNCRDILAGTVGDFTAGELGAFERMLSHVRIFWWVRGGAPLSDFTRGWQANHGIRDAEWAGMLKKGQKPQKGKKEGEIRLVDGWLEIVDPWKWLKSPGADDRTKAERQKRHRDKKKKEKKAMAGSAETESGGGARGATRAPRAPRVAPPILQQHNKEDLQQPPPGKRQEKENQDQSAQSRKGPGSDTAGPGLPAPDTAAGALVLRSEEAPLLRRVATEPPPLSKSDAAAFMAHPTFEANLKLSLLLQAFGPKYTARQKQRLQEAVAEARERGATLGMIYLRMKSRRPAGQNAFDIVREAGTDAHRCLARFREIAGVPTMGWTEIDRMAFDTTMPRGNQQQADWNAARKEFIGVLDHTRALSPIEATRLMEGGGA